jgi:hypothetical protein
MMMAIRPLDEVVLLFIEAQFPNPGNRCHTWGKMLGERLRERTLYR